MSTASATSLSRWKARLSLTTGIAIVVTLLTVLDIHLSLARLTTPVHLTEPSLAYAYIPLLIAIITLAALVIDSALRRLLRSELVRATDWLVLGGCYGLVSLAQPLSALGFNDVSTLGVATVVALSAVAVARTRERRTPTRLSGRT